MAEAGADGIVVETMSDPAEARLAVSAARQTGLPVVACMTFDSGAKKDRTMMGTTPEQAAEQLRSAGADCLGANCGQGIAGFVEICRRLQGRRRPAGVDQGQRRPAASPRRPDGLRADARGVCRSSCRVGRGRCGLRRRLLRHHARFHSGGAAEKLKGSGIRD